MPGRCRLLAYTTVVLTLLVGPRALAQKADTEEIKFDSADGVKLQGTLYKAVLNDKEKLVSAKDVGDCPCVILLHSPGVEPNTGDWNGLAVTLASKGFHVFRIDFRGHGRSKELNKEFWDNAVNVNTFTALAKKKPSKIEWTDIKPKTNYFPYLVNDILAARLVLDRRNDEGKLNTSAVYLIGATDAASLGMFYTAVEWTRPQKLIDKQAVFLKVLPAGYNDFLYEPKDSAGRDIAGAIWLSPRKHPSISEAAMKGWVKTWPDMRDRTPVLCLAGEKDDAGLSASRFIVDEMLVAKPRVKSLNDLPLTAIKPTAGTKNVGVDLLGKQLKTEDAIFKQLEEVEKKRSSTSKIASRNFSSLPLVSPALYGIR